MRKQGRPRVLSPKISISLRMDTGQLKRLDKMAKDLGIARSALIQLAVSAVLDKGLRIDS